MGFIYTVNGFIILNFISPGVRLVLFVNKLGCHLQVTATFVIRATLLLKVNLQGMEQRIYHALQGDYLSYSYGIEVMTYECSVHAPLHTSVL